MAWFNKRRPAAEPLYEEVCTPQGRTAHKRLPDADVVLCRWPAEQWVKAPAFLKPCHQCETEADIIAMEAAS